MATVERPVTAAAVGNDALFAVGALAVLYWLGRRKAARPRGGDRDGAPPSTAAAKGRPSAVLAALLAIALLGYRDELLAHNALALAPVLASNAARGLGASHALASVAAAGAFAVLKPPA